LTSTRTYRLVVYLLDPYKRKVLLVKGEDPGYEGKFVPISFPLPDKLFPQVVIQNYFKETFQAEIEFIFHETSFPTVLDPFTVQTVAPFFTQVQGAADGSSRVDFVYLAFAKAPFKLSNPRFSWCRAEDLVGKISPRPVKRTVRHILNLNKK
jgi:hypothetical protein